MMDAALIKAVIITSTATEPYMYTWFLNSDDMHAVCADLDQHWDTSTYMYDDYYCSYFHRVNQ